MNDIEAIVEAERRRGWVFTFKTCASAGWTCMVESVKPEHLRTGCWPTAGGATQMIALTAAIRCRDNLFTRKAVAVVG
jgi:hypothetical protein